MSVVARPSPLANITQTLISLPAGRKHGLSPAQFHTPSPASPKGCAEQETQEQHPPSASQRQTALGTCDTPLHPPSLEPVGVKGNGVWREQCIGSGPFRSSDG